MSLHLYEMSDAEICGTLVGLEALAEAAGHNPFHACSGTWLRRMGLIKLDGDHFVLTDIGRKLARPPVLASEAGG